MSRHGAGCARRGEKWRLARQSWDLYLLVLVPFASLILFHYLPMAGLALSFKEYKIIDGFQGSDWVGLSHFAALFSANKFYQVLWNTVIINVYKFIFQFPVPILLALLLNEVRVSFIKRGVQTLVYLPHFLSWVVVAGIFFDLLSLNGIVNRMLRMAGLEGAQFLGESRYFRGLMVVTTMWKESGWSTIVYLSAITAIDPQLYEAASVDGAGRLRQTFSITIPNIVNTIAFIIILRASSIMGSDTEQIMMFYRPITYGVGDVIGTYVYREGIINSKFSYTTAVGLFSSTVGMAMMLISNYFARRYTGRGIW